jgi:type IX secretion system PorP/SprF family membrane protein
MFLAQNSFAQDPQFSQYYANPLYLNPGFTGASQEARIGLIYRNQWPSIPDANFQTIALYVDKFFMDQRSGVGLYVSRDRAGEIGLSSTTIAASYAYQLPLTEAITFRPGLQLGYIMQSQDFSDLLFASQFDAGLGAFDPTLPGEANFTGTDQFGMLTVGLGGIVYTDDWFAGVSIFHLNQPSQGFADDNDVELSAKYSIHGGYKFYIGGTKPYENPLNPHREFSIAPAFQYKHQNNFDQIDLGLYFTYEPIVFGFWYRGIPFKTISDQSNSEAIIGLIGINTPGGMNIGYSYDYTISDLGISSGGAHEVTLTYNFIWRDKSLPPMNRRLIPCPKI